MWSDIWFYALIAGLVAASLVTWLYFSRERRDKSPFESSSTGIVLRHDGWFFGLIKLRRIRDDLKQESQMRRHIADYRRSRGGVGAVGNLEKLMHDAQDEQKR